MTLGQRIVFYRKQAGYSQKALAVKVGISATRLNYWEKDKREPDVEMVNALCSALGIDGDTLLGRNAVSMQMAFNREELSLIKKYRSLDGNGRDFVDYVVNREVKRVQDELDDDVATGDPGTTVQFPLSIQPVSAGTGVFLGEDAFKEISIVDNYYTRRAKFALPVSGDSMEPTFHDGDIILVDGAEEIPVGKIGVFTINGEGYVKVLGKGEIISLNPDYAPIPLNECTDIRCNGEVIGVLDPAWIISK